MKLLSICLKILTLLVLALPPGAPAHWLVTPVKTSAKTLSPCANLLERVSSRAGEYQLIDERVYEDRRQLSGRVIKAVYANSGDTGPLFVSVLWVITSDEIKIAEFHERWSEAELSTPQLPPEPYLFQLKYIMKGAMLLLNHKTQLLKTGQRAVFLNAKEITVQILKHWQSRIRVVRGFWEEGVNFDQFNNLIADNPGMAAEEAALMTWTGRLLSEQGFSHVTADAVTRHFLKLNPPGVYPYLIFYFRK